MRLGSPFVRPFRQTGGSLPLGRPLAIVALACWLAGCGAVLAAGPAARRTDGMASTVTSEGVPWLRHARVAGLGLHETASDDTLDEELDRLVEQGVNVVEADASLSDYLNEADFETELAFIRRVVERCHKRGLKVVFYYPSIEVITPDGKLGGRSMKRDHPDWVQKNFDRKTSNFFFGTLAFWVEPNDESAWMCPNSPYRDYFYDRIARLAATGMDGLWLDVPLFNSIVGRWPCADPYCREKFERETGLRFPTRLDQRDPAVRRWILWRHETLARFLEGAHRAARKVNPTLRTVVEVVSCDHMINTIEGLDPTFFDEGLDIVWEVDAISDTTSMADAGRDDWQTLMMVYKFCQGASKRRARWAFTYGLKEDDAQLTMAASLAAQCNPYETRIPQMVTSVGHAFREKMFRWVEKHTDEIFGSSSAAPVAIVYSGATRDFVDGTKPGGFYVTPWPPKPGKRWWVLEPELSVRNLRYLSEYRGWAMMLIEGRIPFDILTANQLDAATLARYRAVVVPAPEALSDEQIRLLEECRKGGACLVVTGPRAGTLDETGATRAARPFDGEQGASASRGGAGPLVRFTDKPGARWLVHKHRPSFDRALEALRRVGVAPVVTNGVPVYVQAYTSGTKLALHVINYGWVGRQPLCPAPVTASVSLPVTGAVARVVVSEPGEKPQVVPHTVSGSRVAFSVPVRINALAIVEGAPR